MDLSVLLICFILFTGISAVISVLLLPALLCHGSKENLILIIPLKDDCSVEMAIKQGHLLSKSLGRKSPKIIAVDLGISEEGRRIYELSSEKGPFIPLCSENDLKTMLSE